MIMLMIIMILFNDCNDVILSDENVNDNDVRNDIILHGNMEDSNVANNVNTNKDVAEKDGDVDIDSGKSAKMGTVKLACTDCKPLTDFEIKMIKDLKEAFGEPVNKFRADLKKIDPVAPMSMIHKRTVIQWLVLRMTVSAQAN